VGGWGVCGGGGCECVCARRNRRFLGEGGGKRSLVAAVLVLPVVIVLVVAEVSKRTWHGRWRVVCLTWWMINYMFILPL